ncbi:hypothetical protein HYQ45_001738 [Verticillium longisporum]|uniref:Mitochondrial inner membrane protein 1 n=1 Tax=Verticillium longisporum TaxID=100787 RepID=A0A0G4M2G6_VERLO|nr:hypothetical protein HYQ44_005970 [Verticillium longisporum]KAG7141699.1 hypothetical protein HYQ45_001738 [Verticillium longisporum]CRK28476.1 hypothetical protein BN1723_003553 [Verticillium longisporum]
MLHSTRAAARLLPRASTPLAAQILTQGNRISRYGGLQSRTVAALYPSRRQYSNSPYDKIDVKAEKEVGKKKIESRPGDVSVDSSTRQVFEPSPAAQNNDSVQDGLAHDLGIVRDTFELSDVPKQPYWLGLAGTIPYLGTSLATVYLSWDLNTDWPSSSTLINHIHMNHESAQYWLDFLEPVQLGYGAVIISFLGAVHWGMEYTAKTILSSRTNFRYGMGVLAPVVAWPTLFMPIEAALITQFSAFTGLYLADARATTRGWTPPWYTKYRFILTGIVGVAIFVSLVGRAKVGSAAPRLGQGLSDRVHENLPNKEVDWAALEKKEKEKNRKLKAEAERKQKEEEAASKEGGRKQSGKGMKSAGDDKDKTKKEDESAKGLNKNSNKAGDQADSESENQPDTKSDGEDSQGKESGGQATNGSKDEGDGGDKSNDKQAEDENEKNEGQNVKDNKIKAASRGREEDGDEEGQ